MTEKSAGSQRSIYRRTVPYIPKHPDPHDPETGEENDYSGESGLGGMFRFEKIMIR